MTNFDDVIRNLKPITAFEISEHFMSLYAAGIIQLLRNLGFGENTPFNFDEKKKKTRLSFHSNTIISIEFEKVPENSSYSCRNLHGYYFKVVYIWDEYGECNIMNIGPETPNLEWWSDIYNYLRIEYNAMKKKKK